MTVNDTKTTFTVRTTCILLFLHSTSSKYLLVTNMCNEKAVERAKYSKPVVSA